MKVDEKKLNVWRYVWKIKKIKKWELTDELFSHFKEVICTLYGNKEKDVNKVQWLKFRDKHSKKDKVIDMSVLRPRKNCKE